jgi:MYXO-CTERM domain-containing protein
MVVASLAAGLLLAAPAAGFAPDLPGLIDCGLTHGDGGSSPRGARRPVLSGETRTVDSDDGLFRIHWTHGGGDAIGFDDRDDNDIPDDVDRTLAGLLEGRSLFAGLGYRDLIPDLGEGGSTALDVYIRDITANGFAHAIDGGVPEPAFSCFMELDNGLGGQGGGILESVAVHELHHCTQYTYTPFTHDWIHEATATLEQYRDRHSGALDAALEFLWLFRLRDHDRPVAATGDRFEYAGFVFLKFWEEFEGGGTVPDLWEALAAEPRWDEGLDTESRRVFGQSFDRTFRDFATWNLFACGRGDGGHYDPTTFPCTLPNTSVSVEALDGGEFTVAHDEVTHTATFHEFAAGGDSRPFEISCEGPGEDAQVRVRLVAIGGSGVRGEDAITQAENDEGFVVRLAAEIDPTGSAALVVASTGEGPAALACRVARVEALEEDGSGCECSSGGGPRRGPAGLILGLLAGSIFRGRRRSWRASSSR